MNKESLDRAEEEIIKVLRDLEIDNIDKLELMLNLSHFLDDKNYKENIKILALHNRDKRRRECEEDNR